ncbi:hypothetical protein AVEN_127221-1 [Araneus ventricosus]|uniref:Integrase catalytic domain-containing protein n=1 Tax=Araneus ventricosus TaxID=182803 RepID=A0A4Y2NT67_ARAVE|nr:hypothetical protein AVEN_127221-1 [Araneus ventricosus]
MLVYKIPYLIYVNVISLGSRRVVKEVLQKCVACRRYTSKTVVPVVPAPLPVDRINRVAAFEVTGSDLAGPIYLKRGEKAWIVIFTCAVYRAIYLELVICLSTKAFTQAMRCFLARRVRSSIMYTDNGKKSFGNVKSSRQSHLAINYG